MKVHITCNCYTHNAILLETSFNGSVIYLWWPLSHSVSHGNIYEAIRKFINWIVYWPQ
jgi:hypothetical protein